MAYKKIKADWQPDDPVMPEHIEQLETQYDEVKNDLEEETLYPKINIGVHVDPEKAPSGLLGAFHSKLNTVLSYIANRIKAITGQDDWATTPPVSLQDLKNHVDADNPHSGSEPADPNIVKTTREATFEVPIVANNNEHYDMPQIRNIMISNRSPLPEEGNNGDIWLVYKEEQEG